MPTYASAVASLPRAAKPVKPAAPAAAPKPAPTAAPPPAPAAEPEPVQPAPKPETAEQPIAAPAAAPAPAPVEPAAPVPKPPRPAAPAPVAAPTRTTRSNAPAVAAAARGTADLAGPRRPAPSGALDAVPVISRERAELNDLQRGEYDAARRLTSQEPFAQRHDDDGSTLVTWDGIPTREARRIAQWDKKRGHDVDVLDEGDYYGGGAKGEFDSGSQVVHLRLHPRTLDERFDERFQQVMGGENAEQDWRPNETIPEDYYAAHQGAPAAPAARGSAPNIGTQPSSPGFFGRLFARKSANVPSQPSSPNVPSSAPAAPAPAPVAATPKPALSATIGPRAAPPKSGTPEWHAQDYATNGVKAQAFLTWFGNWQTAPHTASKVVNPETGEPQPTYEIPPEATTAEAQSGQPGASKVIDKTGAPARVYHGTPRGPFHVFDKGQIANAEGQLFGPGFYFTEDPHAAEVFAKGGHSGSAQGTNPTVMSYYLKAHRPFDVDSHLIDPSKLPPLERAGVRASYVQKALAEDGRSAALEAGREFDAGKIGLRYRELTSDNGVGGYGASKQAVQEMLQKQGYDAMTVQADDVGEPGANRYWIVFDNRQMKSVHNRGTFDPNEPHVLKALDTLPAPQAIALAARLTGVAGIRTRAQARAAVEKGLNIRGHKPGPQQASLWDEDEHPRETESHDEKRPGEFAPKSESKPVDAGTPLRTESVEGAKMDGYGHMELPELIAKRSQLERDIAQEKAALNSDDPHADLRSSVAHANVRTLNAELNKVEAEFRKKVDATEKAEAKSKALKWRKIGTDDYESADGRFKIVRMEAADNKYANRDEWILSVRKGEHDREAVDVYPLLRDAKEAAAEIAGDGTKSAPESEGAKVEPKAAPESVAVVVAKLKEHQHRAVEDINYGVEARKAIRGHLVGKSLRALQEIYHALGYRAKLKNATAAVSQIEATLMSLPGAIHRADA